MVSANPRSPAAARWQRGLVNTQLFTTGNANGPDCVHLSQRFRATPQRVFDAWLDPSLAGQWLFATASQPMTQVAIDARTGGSFCFTHRLRGRTIEHRGKYLVIIPPRRLVFSLSMQDRPRALSRVSVEITPLKRGCQLALCHDDLPADYVHYAEARWTGILYGLATIL